MNRFFTTLSVAAVAVASLTVNAQEPVKTLYSGDPKEVTWESTLSIPAADFAEGVNVGNYIYITFSKTNGAVEIKANGTWLPGSRMTNLGTDGTEFKAYITQGMLDTLKKYGLEICGNFTVTGVSVCNDGFTMPEGAIWGGYCWIDKWSTLEIFKTAFDNYEGQRYMDIYLSDDKGDYTGYLLSVLTSFDPRTAWAENDKILHTARVATVDLQNVNVKESLANVDALIIQGNKEEGNPFNITAVALTNQSVTTGASEIEVEDAVETNVDVYNMQGVKVRSNVSAETAVEGLPAGLYIAGGKKIYVK